ncbi:MAG TPA: HAMP domain-containing histidine kinase, partial [Candidatus Moranbacteria bacterium]|nr:HAMP domain-containing histidine kinase [Candidatus Moranbacteria bacterium]
MEKRIKVITDFIKENPSIIYSLILVVLIPLAIFLNTFFIVEKFQKNIDTITQTKAVLAEDIFNLTVQNLIDDPQKITEIIKKIKAENSEVEMINVIKPDESRENFKIISSSLDANIGKELKGPERVQAILAWNNKEGIALAGKNIQGRFWNVAKPITDKEGNKIALVSQYLSLSNSDKLIDTTILNSYIILAITILLVMLLMANHTRLFKYAVLLEKIKQVDKMKDTFVSMTCHELKAPLTAIKGYLELFEDKNKPVLKADAESAHYFKNITISTERLGSLVNDILEVSRLEGNRIPFNMVVINPQDIIKKSIEEMKSQAIQKGLSLKYLSGTTPQVKADSERVKQILVNLLSNAIKYTPKGNVEVTAKTDEEQKNLLVTVADTGLGISSEEQANLFQKFYRIKNEHTKSISGTG